MALLRSVGVTLEMIKWEHSVFALPFALTGAMLAAGGWPPAVKLLWIVVCMVAARSAAMSVVFLIGAWQLNRLTLLLSPIVLAVLFLYSYTKRFTRWSHLFLGLALGLAPAGAWIAIRGSIDPRILVLTAAVLFWVAGFDLLYACQDEAHDRSAGLLSVPATLGAERAFLIARTMHVAMVAELIALVVLFHLGPIALVGIVAVAALLLWEHLMVSPTDLSRLNAAFFTMNGIISVIFFVFVA